MRYFFVTISLFALAACDPAIPDSNPGDGVGFGSYEAYQARREAELTGQSVAADPASAPVISDETSATDAAETPAAPRPAGISDEQDFSAVAGRETIESDAARLAAVRAEYQQVEPTALPTRSGGSGPSVVEYALNTTNRLGESIYSRSKLFGADRFNRNCAKYSSADVAQQAFLSAGGPQKDRKGLDPDGDGFACYWDPTPFRQARTAASAAPVPAE